MKRRYVLTAGCVLALGPVVFGLTRSLKSTSAPPQAQMLMDRTFKPSRETSPNLTSAPMSFQQQKKSADSSSPQTGEIPEQVVYDELFFNVNFLKNKADDLDRHGKDSSGVRGIYKKEAKLNSRESDKLFEIAANCKHDTDALDERAKEIITEFRARIQAMKFGPGQRPPPPPDELKTMQQERDATVLNARDQLRQAFGEQSFARFNEYVKHSVKPRIRNLPLKEIRTK